MLIARFVAGVSGVPRDMVARRSCAGVSALLPDMLAVHSLAWVVLCLAQIQSDSYSREVEFISQIASNQI